MADIDTQGMTIGFGKHSGELYTRLPCSYLWFMVNNTTREHETARAELDRRGMTDQPELEVSGHAIDGASLRCRKTWHKDRAENEGINSWLKRVSGEVLRDGKPVGDSKIYHERTRLIFVFDHDGVWPILKTIYPANKKQIDAQEQP